MPDELNSSAIAGNASPLSQPQYSADPLGSLSSAMQPQMQSSPAVNSAISDTPAAASPIANSADITDAMSIAMPSLGTAPATVPAMATGASVAGMQNLVEAAAQKGLITQQKVAEIQNQIVAAGKSMEQALADAAVGEEQIYRLKAEMNSMEFVDLTSMNIDPTVLQRIPQETAKRNQAVAYLQQENAIKVAMSDPLDIQKTKFISVTLGGDIIPVYSAPSMINYVIDNRYGAQVGSEVEQALEEVGDATQLSSVVSEVTDLGGNLESAPVSKIVNMVLEYAIRYKASDIHIEPRESKISVRFRIFGVLAEKLTLPKKLLPAVVSRIKILSNLKIDEHRVPQDGRFQVKMGSNNVDLRVSVVPAVYGEKVVMRLLEKGGGTVDLAATGMRGHVFKSFNESLQKTQGIILVTGPTGSGKTQTLASALKVLNTGEVNIMTLEDPVEIRVDGVNQVQVNADVGLTFARGLRSFLRQDPDVIMVGEIRDGETASLAVQAALTGHLVLATLHTNSAAGAPPRLIDMGVEPFLLSSTINILLAQRLVRRICDHCKEAYYADPAVASQIHQILDGIKGYNMFVLPNNDQGDPNKIEDDKIVLYRGKGCPKCNDTGYNGRIGIFEAINVNEGVSKLILQRATAADINKAAAANGMVSMLQDGFMKALEGITTLEEVLRVQSN